MAKRNKIKSARPLLKLEALEQRQLLAGGFSAAQGTEFKDIVHANGNVYDQVLMKTSAISVTNDANQITRVSFLDLQGDIVQAEFSGAGTLSISLDSATGPAAPIKYAQPDVLYMSGLASFTIQGSDATTNFSLFTVGSATAHNGADNPIFAGGLTGGNNIADVARLTIVSDPSNPNGSNFGGVRAGNAIFSNSSGPTGISAANIHIQSVVIVGDINATGSATPTLIVGANSQFGTVTVAGGGLLSANAAALNNTGSYVYGISLAAGTNSAGVADAAEASSTQTFTGNNPLVTAPQIKVLSVTADTLTGGAGNDTFNGTSADVLTVFDNLDGGAGTDTLTVNLTGTSFAAPITVANIEKINVTTSGGGFTLDTKTNAAGFSGLTDLTIGSGAAGAMTVTAATTTNITTSSALTAGNNILINGGLGVTVVSTGASTGTISTGATTASTGAISVTETLIAVDGGTTTGAITVKGGTTVNVAVTGVQGTVSGNGNATLGTVTVTGGASTTSATVAQTVAAGTKEVFVATFATNVDADTITFDGVTVTLTASQTATQNATKFVTDYNASSNTKVWALADGLSGTVTLTKSTTGSSTNIVSGDFVIASGGNGADTSVAAAAPTTDGKAGLVNGTVAITDVNSASTTAAGKIATVDLSGFGAATANSSAITTINLAGAGTSYASQNATVLAQAAVTLNLKGLTTTGAVDVGTKATTLNLVSSTGTNTLAGALTGTAVTAVNISGDKALTLASSSLDAAAVITNTATATVTHTAALAVGQKYIGSAVSDVVNIGVSTVVSDLGDGSDTLTTTGILGTAGRVSGGAGTDTVVMTSAEAAVADDNSTFNTKFTSFEVLRLSNALAASTTLDIAGINAVATVELAAGGANTSTAIISNLVSGGTVKHTGNGTGVVINVANALFNPSDVLNLGLSKSSILAAGTITAVGVETINIAAPDATSTGGTAVIHTATLTAADATSIVVTGNNGLNLTATGSVAVTNFDASAVVGNGVADTAALLKVTYVSVNTTTANAVTIKGGAGSDTLTGAANNDTISGGAGLDLITGGLGADTLTGGADIDTFAFSTDGSVYGTSLDKITDFKATTVSGNVGDILTFGGSTTVLAADVTALAAGSNVNTTVGGLVSFHANDNTYLLQVAAIQADSQLDAIGSVAMFTFGGDTYVYYAGAATGNADDQIIQLTGVTALTTITGGATTVIA